MILIKLPMYSFNYLDQYRLMYSFFIQWVILKWNCHLFWFGNISQTSLVRVLWNWILCSLLISPLFFEYFLTFWLSKMLQAHLALSSISGISHFLQEVLFPFSGWMNVFRTEILRTMYSHCSWGVTASGLSQWSLLRIIFV